MSGIEVHPAETLPRLAGELWGNPKPLGLRQERLLDIHRASVAPPDRFEPPFAPQHPSSKVFRIYLNLLRCRSPLPPAIVAPLSWTFTYANDRCRDDTRAPRPGGATVCLGSMGPNT